MSYIIIFCTITFLYNAPIFSTVDETSPYFNTSFLIHYEQVTSSLLNDGFRAISPLLTLFKYFLWPCAILRSEATDIRPLCANIEIPIFFIPARNDAYISFDLAYSCADYASKCWWPIQAEHACIYLQYKQAYQNHLHDFFAQALH